MLINYIIFALIFGFVYGSGVLHYNILKNEQFNQFLTPDEGLSKTLINGLFVGLIFLLTIAITASAMPLILLEGLIKCITQKFGKS